MPPILNPPDQCPLSRAPYGIHLGIGHAPTGFIEYEVKVSPGGLRQESKREHSDDAKGDENMPHAIRIGLMPLTLRTHTYSALTVFLFVGIQHAAAQTQPGTADEPPPAPPPNCSVAAFRTLALETPEMRRTAAAMAWLKSTGKDCSLDRLILIRNNRVQWLGVVDSATLAGEIDRLIEEKSTDSPSTVQSLYTSASPGGGAAPPK